MSHEQARRDLRKLMTAQSLAVLATDEHGHPYSSLVAFVATSDLKNILFATTRGTRKYRNIVANPRVSLLVDSRANNEADFHEAMAATVLGTARECVESGGQGEQELFVKRHPHLVAFVRSPSCVLLSVDVDFYYLVQRFQDVVEVKP